MEAFDVLLDDPVDVIDDVPDSHCGEDVCGSHRVSDVVSDHYRIERRNGGGAKFDVWWSNVVTDHCRAIRGNDRVESFEVHSPPAALNRVE